jgi:hypothetical protein
MLWRRVPDQKGARHVCPAGACLVAWPNIDHDWKSRREWATTGLVAIALVGRPDYDIWRATRSPIRAYGAQLCAYALGGEDIFVDCKPSIGGWSGA